MPWPGLAINQALAIHHCAMKKGQKGREDITKKLPLAAAHLTYKYPQRTQRKAKGKEIQFQQTGSCDIPKICKKYRIHERTLPRNNLLCPLNWGVEISSHE